jgi:hypothetical protein
VCQFGSAQQRLVLTLTLDGDMINATMEFAGGQLSISGTGKKQ